MKKICITIDKPTERRLNFLSASWKVGKSETIRYCIDQVYTDKCYNGYGILAVPKKKGGEKRRNAKNH